LQAILLATGEVEKLLPLTKTTASPMIPVVNRPVMEIAVEQLARNGIKQIIVCLYNQAGSIEAYFGDGRRWGVDLSYVLLREAWGTAGVLRWAKPLIHESFIVVPADSIIDLDIGQAFDQHHNDQNMATVIVNETGARDFRRICLDEDGVIEGIALHNNCDKVYYETGVYLFSPEVFKWIPSRTKFDIHTNLLPAISDAGQQVCAFIMTGYWNPLESFRDIGDAQKTFLYSTWGNDIRPENHVLIRYPSITGKKMASGIWIGRNSVIHPSARLLPPLLLGENIRIGRDVEIGPEVVVGDNVIIADEATLHNSTILDHSYVGQLVSVEDRLINKTLVIDLETSEHIRVSDRFLLGETPHSLEMNVFQRIFDITLALSIALLLSPLFLCISIVLFLSGGKIFQTTPCFKSKLGDHTISDNQERTNFDLFHFRTRKNNGHYNLMGRWLEQLELNRLPEIFNIILGDLKLVGVKPLTADEANRITEDWQRRHNDYFPGLTGLWYLHAERGSGLDEILVADVYYVATRTLKLDLKILWNTPGAWIKKIGKFNLSGDRIKQGGIS